MAKLHELLAAEKTPTASWNHLYEETLKKFKTPETYFQGHSKALRMIDETEANKALEAQAREEKPVATTVYDTLEYAFGVYAKMEDMQYQKNVTDRDAVGTVMWRGTPLLVDVPVGELLGLEARLTRIRLLYEAIPTLDASKHWDVAVTEGARVWQTRFPDETTKTDKQLVPVVMQAATKEHPAQVQAVQKDVVVGRVTVTKRSGCATAQQKADSLRLVDELMIEVKAARMRANETPVVRATIADKITALLLSPFAGEAE